MGLFKKRPPLDPKDELQLHKIEISAMWSEKEQKFVSYDTMHVEGEINRLAGLLHKVADSESAFKKLLEKSIAGPKRKVEIKNITNFSEEITTSTNVKSKTKPISEMTAKEIEEMIRKNNNDMKS